VCFLTRREGMNEVVNIVAVEFFKRYRRKFQRECGCMV
jgi:hypothetical protein